MRRVRTIFKIFHVKKTNIKAQHSVVFDVSLSQKPSFQKINKPVSFLVIGLSIFVVARRRVIISPFLLPFINPQTSCHSIEALFAYIVTFTTNILMSAMSSAVRMAANMSMKVRVDVFRTHDFFLQHCRRFCPPPPGAKKANERRKMGARCVLNTH